MKARLFFQCLANYNNANLPNRIKIAKVGLSFCQILNKPSENGQDFLNFAKVVKFSQIWSH